MLKSRGIVAAGVDADQRADAARRAAADAMLTSRLAASGVKFAGKFATTSTRYGSATSPAARLYSSIVLYWFRRYFWITLSMWSVRSVSRCSMCVGSVQICDVTSFSSWSARCMNAAKFSPRPTGSMIVNRTLPGGRPVRKRSIIAWSASTAGGAALVAGAQQHRAAVRERQERRHRARESSSGGASRGSVGMPSGNGLQIDLELAAPHSGRHAVGSGRSACTWSHGGKSAVALGAERGERAGDCRRSPPSTAAAIFAQAASRAEVAAAIFSA